VGRGLKYRITNGTIDGIVTHMENAKEITERDWPVPVLRALRQAGASLRDARRRRRISTELMAQRIAVGRTTLHRLEKGDPTVAMGTYASALFVLGMVEQVAQLADIRFDSLGQALDEEQLPQRIRSRRS
jgi:DNA-binding XRE family transcriptional regulator